MDCLASDVTQVVVCGGFFQKQGALWQGASASTTRLSRKALLLTSLLNANSITATYHLINIYSTVQSTVQYSTVQSNTSLYNLASSPTALLPGTQNIQILAWLFSGLYSTYTTPHYSTYTTPHYSTCTTPLYLHHTTLLWLFSSVGMRWWTGH